MNYRTLTSTGCSAKPVTLIAVLVGMIALSGCGSGDEASSDRSDSSAATEERDGNAAPDPNQQSEKDSDGSSSQTPEEERVARLIERMREAERQEPSEELGCKRFNMPSARGSYPSIGPPPPDVEVSRATDGVLISYRFSSLPNNETCRPFGLYMTVLGADVPNRSPTFENSSEKLQLRGLSGQRVVEFPLAGKPPYNISVRSVSITGRRGPPVTIPVPGR